MATFNDTTPNLIASDSSNVDGSTLGASQALLLDGSFSIAQNTFTIEQCDHAYTIQSCDTERFASYSFKAPTYYIMVTDDINANVNYHPGANDANDSSLTNDDAWSLSELSYTQANDGIATKKLPAGGSTVKVATISVCDEVTAGTTFDINMAITLGNDGAIAGTASVSGSDHTGYLSEDVTLAQEAYWFTEPASAPGKNDGDVLAATVTSAMLSLQNDTSNAISAMETNVTGNVVQSWSLTIDTVEAAPGSNLSQYAQSAGATSAALFANDEKVVADAQQLYTVNITHNSTTTLLVNDYVYGMVKHAGATSRSA